MASFDEGDDVNSYKTKLAAHIERMETAEKVITELTPKMTAFCEKVRSMPGSTLPPPHYTACRRIAWSKKVKDLIPMLQKVGGKLDKIEALFTDMAPEPQKGKPMPPGMINALVRVPKEATTCTVCDPFSPFPLLSSVPYMPAVLRK